ncbi:hypothetical protein [Bacillus weihaiensis]|uniref:Pilus assembly protein PilO n=1 Tax=Bacillus weihaiensis TaxID=1547283 RepID=A0A1L3MPF9_9BACI|nr:hypothetical protein [Bacillus weihaiensis]APH04226.1 hypothetical protein A9C19_05425 [Bacillus weihaiensis]
MIDWNRKHTIILFISVVLIGIGSYLLFFLSVQSKDTDIQTLQNQLDTENQLIETLQQDTTGVSSSMLSSVELQKILPVSPFEEQFLLELEKAETMTNSTISSISFAEGETIGADNSGDELVEAYDEKLDPDSASEDTETVGDEAVPEIVPEGVQKLTVELSVQSPSYYELEEFVKILETTQRITQVESIQVTGLPEIFQVVEDLQTSYDYTLIVSTFYFPKLEELQDQLPPFTAPNPSEKENPFVDLIKEEEKKEEN